MEPPTDPEAVDKLRRHLRILVDLGRISGEVDGLERFLDVAVVQVARAVEIEHAKIMVFRPETADLLLIAGRGWKPGVVRSATFSSDLRSPPGRSMHTGQPVIIPDAYADTARDFVISPTLREHGIRALCNVPVLAGGGAWGVLEVDSTSPRDFSEDTVEFLSAAAAIVGAGIERRMPTRSDAVTLASEIARAEARELLLRELQHRAKNNFQILQSSVSIQRRRFANAEVDAALDVIAARINAISMAHDQLAPNLDLRAVHLAPYLRTLCASIERQTDNVAIEIEADEIELHIDRAVALGLILNELATNSSKYAFGPEGGRIQVRLNAGVGFDEAQLVVADNGRGMEDATGKGSGLQLVAALARQFGGTVRQRSSPRGTETTVTFPVIA